MSRVMATKEDLRLIRLMVTERNRLKRELSNLSNAAIADKVELSHSCVRAIIQKARWVKQCSSSA